MIDEKGTLRDASNLRIGVLEGISLLVNHGWDTHFLLDECPIDVFKDLVLVAQKQKLVLQQVLGITILSSIGSLFTKEAGAQLQKVLNENMQAIDDQLRGDFVPHKSDNDYDEVVTRTRVPRARSGESTPPDNKKVMQMWSQFHQNFSRLTGAALPPLDTIIAKAQKSQAAGMEMAKATTAKKATEK